MTEYKFGDAFDVKGMKFNDFDDYQNFAATTDKAGTNLNCLLGLMGEIGEVAEKLKKHTRVHNMESFDLASLPLELREDLAKEVGDILWYLCSFSRRLGYRLGTIALMNVTKLDSRKQRGVLHGKGDNR